MTRNVESIFGAVVTAPHQIPYTYTATGGEKFISLPFYPVTGIVTINGGMQVPLDNFEIDGNTLNLGRALSKGDVVFCLFDKILSPEDYKTGIRIYKFQAIGGETEFTPDYTSYGVQSLYIGGEYKTPEIEYSYDSTTGKVSLQTALTAGVWVVAEMSVKQPNISPLFDRSIQEIARSANVKDSEVILSTDTTQSLNGKKVIYSVSEQKAYGLPSLPSNVYISSVSNGQLTYNPGNLTVTLLPTPQEMNTRELWRRSLAEAGYNLVDGSFEAGGTLVNANDVLLQESTGKAFSGPAGPVAAGTNPTSGGFVDQSGNITVDVGTYALLRSYTGSASKIRCLGRSNPFDRASGFFVLDVTDSSTADDDATILVGVGGRRWKRQFNGDADVRWWGAADGIECASAFQKAADYSIATGKRIWVDGDFHLDSSVVIGSPLTEAVATFVGPSSSTLGSQFGARLRFSGCDGFRISSKNILRLSNILLDGDRGVSPPASYAEYLLSLTKSAVRSHEETANRNCITFIENCRFIKWKIGLDFSRGSWSSAYVGNSFAYCYQAGIHFRPNNSVHHKNIVGFCTQGFELIEQNGGEFTLNELNTGVTTEWLVKMTRVAAVDCSNNYVEFWTGGLPSVGGSVNYGLGFIPIIVQLDRYTTSVPMVNGNKIDVPGAYCGILYVQAPGQENLNCTATCPQPVGNSIVATNKIVVATTGTGFLAMTEFVAAGDIKTAKVNGSTARCMCLGSGAMTKMKKSWATRADITAAVAASSPVAGTPDVVFDTTGGALLTTDGAYSPATTFRKSKITISVYAETDATPTNTKITVSKYNSEEKSFFINVPANSKSNFNFVFTQDPSSTTEDVSVKFSGGTAHPTMMSVEVLREVFISA